MAALILVLALSAMLCATKEATDEEFGAKWIADFDAFTRTLSQDLVGTWEEYNNPKTTAAYGDPPSVTLLSCQSLIVIRYVQL